MIIVPDYWRIIDGKKVYYSNGRLIGDEYLYCRYLVSSQGVSFTNARKKVSKVKELVGAPR